MQFYYIIVFLQKKTRICSLIRKQRLWAQIKQIGARTQCLHQLNSEVFRVGKPHQDPECSVLASCSDLDFYMVTVFKRTPG